ncbi:hypothetical protein [Candidatus Amarobacter glycogenicus]|uniref:hypothetical protein n=1 Tax=Candidatus Amarobacter glycogenicus TaxID=3140699 RepID=UPI0031360018|nr:hypothetical protein [Dehalococcoidia bacterium]
MEEFLPQRNFIVPWREVKAFLRDEQRMTAVYNRSAEIWRLTGPDAYSLLIFESSGETDINVHSGGRGDWRQTRPWNVSPEQGLSSAV